jgi:hypothetical protein
MSKVKKDRQSRGAAAQRQSPMVLLGGGLGAAQEEKATGEAAKLFDKLASKSIMQQVSGCRSLATLVRIDAGLARAFAEQKEAAAVVVGMLRAAAVPHRVAALQALSAAVGGNEACAATVCALHAMNRAIELLTDVSESKVQLKDEKEATEYVGALVALCTVLCTYSLVGAEQVATAQDGELVRFLLGMATNDNMDTSIQSAVLSLLLVVSENNAPFAAMCSFDAQQQPDAPLAHILVEMASGQAALAKVTACAILLNVTAEADTKALFEKTLSEVCGLVAGVGGIHDQIAAAQNESDVAAACDLLDALILALECIANAALGQDAVREALMTAQATHSVGAAVWEHLSRACAFSPPSSSSASPTPSSAPASSSSSGDASAPADVKQALLDNNQQLDEQERADRQQQKLFQPLESRVVDVIDRCLICTSNMLQAMTPEVHGLDVRVLFKDASSVLRVLLSQLGAVGKHTEREQEVVMMQVSSACNLLWQVVRGCEVVEGGDRMKTDFQGLLKLARMDCAGELRVTAIGVVGVLARQQPWFQFNFVTCVALLEVLGQYTRMAAQSGVPTPAAGLEIVAATLHALMDVYSEDNLHTQVLQQTKLLDVLEQEVLPQFAGDVQAAQADEGVLAHLHDTLENAGAFLEYKRSNP